MAQPIITLFILCCIFIVAEARYRSTAQFQEWYPGYGPIFSRIRDDNCSTEFQNYLTGTSFKTIEELESQGGSERSRFTQPVMLCILDNTNEYIKAALASAQVILGGTPAILAIIGPSSQEFATLSVVGGRPILSVLLALAAPSVFSSRAFDVMQLQTVLDSRKGAYLPRFHKSWQRRVVVLVEYLLALGALGNLGIICYQAGIRCPNPISSNFIFFPLVWAAIAFPIHVMAIGLMRMRKRYAREGSSPGFWARELSLSEPTQVRIWWTKETQAFVIGGWVHSIFIVTNLVFGTVMFSSLQFIGQSDAVLLLVRFAVSGLVCRMVLMYELAVLRKSNINIAEQGDRTYGMVPLTTNEDGNMEGASVQQTITPLGRVAMAKLEDF